MIQEVHDNYVSPSHATAFSGPGNLKNYYDRRYGTKPILNTLQHIDGYTLHREFHKPRTTNPFYIFKMRDQIQMDLFDVSALKNDNRGVTFILLAIDTFTKYCWARELKSKSGVNSVAAIKSIVDSMGNPKPKAIFFDRGTEFTNRLVKKYLQEKQIKIVHPNSEKKAAIVERANRTIQGILYRFLTQNQTRTYTYNLQDLIDSYNDRRHRTIKMAPSEAEVIENQQDVLNALNEHYGKIAKKRKNPKYSVGERVLIANLATNRFRRGYQQSFNFEQFEIVQVKTNMPIPMYIVKSLNDDEIVQGGFYAEELQPIKGEVYKVDSVLRKRKVRGRTQLFVKWRGFDDTHNSWINESDVVEKY